MIHLSRKIGAKALAKGRRKWPYQLTLIGVWVGGEILGMVIGFMIFGSDGIEPYLLALGTAVLGSIASFIFIGRVTPLEDVRVTEVFE